MSNFIITEVNIRDYAQTIITLIGKLQEHECSVRPQRAVWQDISDKYYTTLLDDMDNHESICLLAKINNKAVGFICGWIAADEIGETNPHYAYLAEAFVEPEHRRLGIYKAMLQKFELFAKSHEVNRVITCAIANNHAILESHQKNGYSPYYTAFEKFI